VPIPRYTIPFTDIIKLSKGQTLFKSLNNRFFKTFKDLNINIKSVTVTITQTNKKILDVNNYYHPFIINHLSHKQINKNINK
jgi:hypothetical protein